MKTLTINMFAETNEDMPIISGMALTSVVEEKAQPAMITETHPYRIWLDSWAGYASARFATLEDAIHYTVKFREPYHLMRVELDNECMAITLPKYYWDKN